MPSLCWRLKVIVGAALTLTLCAGVDAQKVPAKTRTHEPEIWPGEPCSMPVDRLIALLGSNDPAERWAAAECLGETRDARAAEPLVRAIFAEKYPRLVMIEENALRDINNPHAEDLLLNALKRKETRGNAAQALGSLRASRAVDPLVAMLRSHDRWNRGDAAEALGRIKDFRATDPLCAALKDRNEVVRRFVASSLGELGDTRAVDSLNAALKDRDDGVRWNAANSLGDLKDPRAVDPLVTALNDSEEIVQKAAADALGKIGDPRAVGPLITALRSGSGGVQWHAAAVLADMHDPQIADALIASLNQGRLDVVAAAHPFFIRRGNPDWVPILIEALNKYGRFEMAQDYMICGQPRLVDAAHQWASKNKLDDLGLPEGRVLDWGSERF